MSGYFHRTSAAIADLEEQYVYIGNDHLDAAERFMQAAHECFQTLANNPNLGRAFSHHNPALGKLRVWTIPRFTVISFFIAPLTAVSKSSVSFTVRGTSPRSSNLNSLATPL